MNLNMTPISRSMYSTDFSYREAVRYRTQLTDSTYELDGALYWHSNDAPVPMSVFYDASVTPPAGQEQAIETHTIAALKAYRDGQMNMSDEARAEQAFEMRAAFGAGERVVNIITGEVFNT